MTLLTPKMFNEDNPALSFRERVRIFELLLIKEAIRLTKSQLQAAKALKMDRTVLRRILSRGR